MLAEKRALPLLKKRWKPTSLSSSRRWLTYIKSELSQRLFRCKSSPRTPRALLLRANTAQKLNRPYLTRAVWWLRLSLFPTLLLRPPRAIPRLFVRSGSSLSALLRLRPKPRPTSSSRWRFASQQASLPIISRRTFRLTPPLSRWYSKLSISTIGSKPCLTSWWTRFIFSKSRKKSLLKPRWGLTKLSAIFSSESRRRLSRRSSEKMTILPMKRRTMPTGFWSLSLMKKVRKPCLRSAVSWWKCPTALRRLR